MSDNVKAIDFGKDRREFEAKLFRLLGIVERQREALRKNPVKFYEMACEEIVRLRQIIEDAQEASRVPIDFAIFDDNCAPSLSPRKTWVVDKEELDGLRRMKNIIMRSANLYPDKQEASQMSTETF